MILKKKRKSKAYKYYINRKTAAIPIGRAAVFLSTKFIIISDLFTYRITTNALVTPFSVLLTQSKKCGEFINKKIFLIFLKKFSKIEFVIVIVLKEEITITTRKGVKF